MTGQIPDFGSNFEIDATNRLKPIELMHADERSDVPSYISLGQKARKALRESLGPDKELPEFPKDIESIEDLFETVHETVAGRWNEYVLPTLKNTFTDMNLPFKEANEQIIAHQLSPFENLRNSDPNTWRSLIVLSSEEQLAEVVLFRHWVKTSTPKQLESIGVTKDTLEIVSDLSAILGKYVDHGYLKQMELADKPGGSSTSFLNVGQDEFVDGTEYMYDISSDNILTYSQVFPYEWPKICSRIDFIADKIHSKYEKGSVPESFESLSSFLKEIATTYSSQETNPEVLYDKNDELLNSLSKCVASGCPVVVIPQSTMDVAGDAMKVDIELRLGLRTPKTLEFDKRSESYADIVDALNREYFVESTKLLLTHTLQPFAFGPNLISRTRGENDEYVVFSHINAVQEVAVKQELPLTKNFLPNESISEEKYKYFAVLETDLHENAHLILDPENTDNEDLKKRVGVGEYYDMVEETKAETVGMLILSKQHESGLLTDEDLKMHLIAKIGTNLDYVANKSPQGDSNKYYYAGIAVLHTLLNSNGVEINEQGQVIIKDTNVCVEALSNYGKNILSMYSELNTKPEDIKKFGKEIESYVEDTKLISVLNAIEARSSVS